MSDPARYLERSKTSIAAHVRAHAGSQKKGAIVFDYGNNIRQEAGRRVSRTLRESPGFVPEFNPAAVLRGKGPFRWAALSGDPQDIHRHRRGGAGDVPGGRGARSLDPSVRATASRFRAAGAHLLAGVRRQGALRTRDHDLVAKGAIKAPIVIGRDHLDAGSVASPTARPRECATDRTPSPTGRS